MNLLFIQGGSRVKKDDRGNYYTDGNFNNDVWARYKMLCKKLTVILRIEEKVYDYEYAKSHFSEFDTKTLKYVPVGDVYRPLHNVLNVALHKTNEKIICDEVKKADFIIIRSAASYYCKIAAKYCKKFNKPYLIEVTGFAYEGAMNHGFIGKMVALQRENTVKKAVYNAPYVLYVTEKALQNRYPTKGLQLGCSDVFCSPDINSIRVGLQNRNKILIGTAAFLDVKWKGQIEVIRALGYLKRRGITNVEYHLAGIGDGIKLKNEAKKQDVEEQIIFEGALSNIQIKGWYKSIDVYIQPSYQEGLCRSIVEAMSMGCPVLCSDVGGNFELVEDNCLFEKKNYKAIASKLQMIDEKFIVENSKRNISKAMHYDKEKLDKKRNDFYIKCLSGGINK